MKKLYFIATLIFTLSICLGYYVDAPIVKTVGQVHELQNQITISVFWDILVNNTVPESVTNIFTMVANR
uniref:Uncharacterized protein n=1 Tax=Geobacillus sp. (strain WCH70) TaxID=471223 RepID=C5D896_GEOSW